jgi:hypothetical protein
MTFRKKKKFPRQGMLFQLGRIFSLLDPITHFLVDICNRYEILEKVQGFRVVSSGLRGSKLSGCGFDNPER